MIILTIKLLKILNKKIERSKAILNSQVFSLDLKIERNVHVRSSNRRLLQMVGEATAKDRPRTIRFKIVSIGTQSRS